MINADLKHWGGRRAVNGPYEIDYKRFAAQARSKLGEGGIVGIPNARGPDNPLGAEHRFEEFYELADKNSPIKKLGDGRVFRDNEYKIWFVKTQEVNSQFNEKKLTYLIFNIPFGKNFNEKNNEALYNPDTINVLNLPSCIEQTSGNIFHSSLLPYFDGIITHSSSSTLLIGTNKKARNSYNKFVKGKSFYDEGIPSHYIGAIAVSGGHRSPKEGLLQKITSPISVGSSYTIFPDFNGKNIDEFNDWLKNSIESSQDTNKLVKGSIKREMLSKHLPRMFQEVLSGRRKKLF